MFLRLMFASEKVVIEERNVSKSAYIRVRIKPELKMQVDAVFRELGVTTTQVIAMLYKQVVRNHEIPFDLRPKAIKEDRKE